MTNVFLSYRELLKGVDSLKLVSQVLASVDKITDFPLSPDEDDSGRGSHDGDESQAT